MFILMAGVGGHVFSLLAGHWKCLVNAVFSDDITAKLGFHYDVVVFSFCRLWSRMLKHCARPEALNNCGPVVESVGILLDRLKSGRLPWLCCAKCLAVLLRSVQLDLSSPSSVPTWMMMAAERTLRELYIYNSDDGCVSPTSWSFNCCLFANNHRRLVGSQLCDTSKSLTTDNRYSGTVTTMRNATVGDSEPLSVDKQQAATVTIGSSDAECTSLVQNTDKETITVFPGLCSLPPTCPLLCADVSFVEDLRDSQTVSYDVKLVRKFMLLLLRSMDIVAKESIDQRKPLSLVSV